MPREWGIHDPKAQFDNDAIPLFLRRGDEESRRPESYVLEIRDLVETFDRVWMPVPLLRRELSGGFFRGRPVNWARIWWHHCRSPISTATDPVGAGAGTLSSLMSSSIRCLSGASTGRRAQRPAVRAARPRRADRLVLSRRLGQGLVPGGVQGDARTQRTQPPRQLCVPPVQPGGTARADAAFDERGRYKALVDLAVTA